MPENPEIDETIVNTDDTPKSTVISIRFKTLEQKTEFDAFVKSLVNKGISKTPGDAVYRMYKHCKKSIFF